MPPEDAVPPWVDFVLRRMDQGFAEINKRLDNGVSAETFRAEQVRNDERFKAAAEANAETKAAVQAEATARTAATTADLERQLTVKNDQEKTRRQTNWQWLFIVVGIIATPIWNAVWAVITKGGN